MRFQIIWLFCLVLFTNSLKVNDFLPSLFKFTSIEEGFRNIDTGPNTVGQVMAFADINGDRMTDYVAVQNRTTTFVYFYIWSQGTQQFIQYKRNLNVNSSIQIQQILVHDMNQNGDNQLVITLVQNSTNNSSSNNKSYQMRIYSLTCYECTAQLIYLENSSIPSMIAVPFLIDNQGVNTKIVTFMSNQRAVYIYSWAKASQQELFYIFSEISNFSSLLNKQFDYQSYLIQNHFASQIDLNNDCFSDLLIVSYQIQPNSNLKIYGLQVYVRQTNNNFVLFKYLTLSPQIQYLNFLTFSDMDNSGTTDLVLTYLSSNSYTMKVLFNTESSDLCDSFSSGAFPFSQTYIQNMRQVGFPLTYQLISLTIPHFGDVNSDGLPDLFILMNNNDGYQKAVLLINQNGHKFKTYSDQWDAYNVNNPVQTLFYDYGDDGKIDLMVLSQQNKNQNGQTVVVYSRTSVINNLQSDTLYLKILPLSYNSHFSQQKQNSASMGVTIQWFITDINGNQNVKVANQYFQQNYGSLQLPYTQSGLGRTNNYIEDLTIGFSRIGQKEDWTPIIPNSQLVVYNDNGWKLQTLLKNNQRVNDVIYVSVMILICMGAVIFYLNYKQTQQDKRDHYNFIQLIR